MQNLKKKTTIKTYTSKDVCKTVAGGFFQNNVQFFPVMFFPLITSYTNILKQSSNGVMLLQG